MNHRGSVAIGKSHDLENEDQVNPSATGAQVSHHLTLLRVEVADSFNRQVAIGKSPWFRDPLLGRNVI
jgi:hypothetical protein